MPSKTTRERVPLDPDMCARIVQSFPVGDSRECWEWDRSRLPSGYGRLSLTIDGKRRYVYAHRVAWVAANQQDISPDLVIDHLCRNTACVNPAHLETVSYSENVYRSPIHPATVNRLKTRCVRGHEFNEKNTYVDGKKRRLCLACRREYAAARWQEGRADRLAELACQRYIEFVEAVWGDVERKQVAS